MKLLLLFGLPLCSIAFFVSGEVPRAPKHGILSVEQKAKLFQEWKYDPEVRRARLERMGKKFSSVMKETENNQLVKPYPLSALLPEEIQTPKPEEILSIVEINQRAGVAPYLFDGDVDLTEEQLVEIERMAVGTGAREKRQIRYNRPKWEGNTLYFYFDDSITNEKKQMVHEAHETIEKHTCIKFVENKTAVNRVKVYNGAGCFSKVGMIGGEQGLSFGDDCPAMEAIAHEFIHALGSHHMQSRSDRDNYVTIDTSYVDEDNKNNFDKYDPDFIYTPYDYGSVMHYDASSFVNKKGALSIIPKDERYLFGMGNVQFSFYDFELLNERYGCHDACNAQNSASCKNGGVPNPNNCSKCNCPRGYGGDLCDELPFECGREVEATEEWNFEQLFHGLPSTTLAPQGKVTYCNHWITAPAGKEIEVKILYMDKLRCQYGCIYNGFEIKTDADPKKSNPVYCCDKSFTDKVFRSSLNPLPIVTYSRMDYIAVAFEYRYVNQTAASTTSKPVEPKVTATPAPFIPSNNCKDMNDNCDLIWGICDGAQPFNVTKYNCGKTCGLCGQAASPCVDSSQCAGALASGGCAALEPMYAEFYCAKTCGYCEHPN